MDLAERRLDVGRQRAIGVGPFGQLIQVVPGRLEHDPGLTEIPLNPATIGGIARRAGQARLDEIPRCREAAPFDKLTYPLSLLIREAEVESTLRASRGPSHPNDGPPTRCTSRPVAEYGHGFRHFGQRSDPERTSGTRTSWSQRQRRREQDTCSPILLSAS